MTTRKPLVNNAGEYEQLQSGDALGGITGGTAPGEAMTQDQFGTNYNKLGPTGTPQFARMGVGVAASGASQALLCCGGNPTTFTSANYAVIVDSSAGGALVLAKDGSNYSTIQFSAAGGCFTFTTAEAGSPFANTFVCKGGNVVIGGLAISSGATRNVIYSGGPTSPVLGAAAADLVSTAGIDVGTGNRELYARNEAGQANRLTGLSCRASSDFTKTSSTTLSNVTGLSRQVNAGEVYGFRAVLFTTSDVAAGIKFAIGGTATATSLIAAATVIDTGVLKVPGTERVTALGTTLGDVTAVTVANVVIEGQIVVNAAGTLTVQCAQNVSNGTGSKVLAGSYFELISLGA